MTVKAFLQSTHLSLQQWDLSTLLDLAHNQGYNFTGEELETAADELWGNLTEDQLHDISGSGGNGRSTTGPVIPVLDRKETSGAWSPPPGDVSGNSCFFIRG